MTDLTERRAMTGTTTEVARVLGTHYPDQTSYDAGDLFGCACGWEVPRPRSHGMSDWDAYWAHQAEALAKAGLLSDHAECAPLDSMRHATDAAQRNSEWGQERLRERDEARADVVRLDNLLIAERGVTARLKREARARDDGMREVLAWCDARERQASRESPEVLEQAYAAVGRQIRGVLEGQP